MAIEKVIPIFDPEYDWTYKFLDLVIMVTP